MSDTKLFGSKMQAILLFLYQIQQISNKLKQDRLLFLLRAFNTNTDPTLTVKKEKISYFKKFL